MDIETENHIDSDMVLIPLNDELAKCSKYLSDEESSTSFINCKETTKNGASDEMSVSTKTSSSNCINFKVRKEDIPCIPNSEQAEELLDLDVNVYDQTRFENEVMEQVDKAMQKNEEKKRTDGVLRELNTVTEDIKFVKKRLNHIEKALAMAPKDSSVMTSVAKREIISIKKEQENKLKHLKKLEAKQKALQACVSGCVDDIRNVLQEGEDDLDEDTKYHLQKVFTAKETEEERLIRLGEMTPFGTNISQPSISKQLRKIVIPVNELTDFDKFLISEAEASAKKKAQKTPEKKALPSTSKILPVVSKSPEKSGFKTFTDLKAVPRTKTKYKIKLGSKYAKGYCKKININRDLIKNYKSDSEVSDFEMDKDPLYGSDEEYFPDQDISDEWEDIECIGIGNRAKKKISKSTKKINLDFDSDSDYEKASPKKIGTKKVVDDGDQESYIKRLRTFEKTELIKKHKKILESENGIVDDEDDYTEFDEDFRIPNSVWNKLYKYQQTGVRWLWELHQQNCGGIIGDEMGLGKTIQVIAFLVGLKYSQLKTIGDTFEGLGPVMLVCPATVMHQWVKEFHTWWPPFRVAILHESGSFVGKKELLVRQINRNNGILITSYAGVVVHQTSLLEKEWHYVILDEGHKIRNPDAQATLVVKQFRTSHRIILSGSPVQNNLKELWSLFDFIFPGKLGTLPVFMQQFSVPIVQGGYANASQIQVQTAYKCATVLRDTIKPYLLRRMKTDVKMSINLPNKSEQVLFCQLTEKQANLYKGYINSKEVDSILNARLQVFVGLINLRKLCNHPDLFDGGPKIFKNTDTSLLSEEDHFGYYKRSGKMIVVEALLRLWYKQGHRVLLFTQSRQMMEVLENFLKKKNYTYMKMDGSSSIGSRQPAIAKFNSDKSIFVFLLTTRVGGLGVNLTGANRVIIYDPDWNPSTDAQAKERAWRIGQEKQVTIYRLLTAGTIEEKIYHRQIFKQFVTNRVLKDPRQRRFFKSNDLYELFTYQELGKQGTETSAIFAGTGSEVKVKKKYHTSHDDQPSQAEKDSAIHPEKKYSVSFSAEKLEQMKLLAKKLSAEFNKKNENDANAKKESLASNKLVKSQKKKDTPKKMLYSELKNCKSMEHNLKHSVKKTRKRKSQVVDGEKIDFLVKKDVYKLPQNETEKNAKDDDYVLSKLFKTSGVHTALKHDKIVESSDPDYMIVEGEASRVAKDAIKALRDSRRMCLRAEEGVPTWTGHHGGTKLRFGQKKKVLPVTFVQPCNSLADHLESLASTKFDGTRQTTSRLSSGDLLSAIKKRKKVFGTDNRSDASSDEDFQAGPSQSQPETEYDELLVDIRNFVAFGASVDGQATTKELIDAFQSKLPVKKTAVFKSMLSKICDFSRASSGDGMWYLKEEFR